VKISRVGMGRVPKTVRSDGMGRAAFAYEMLWKKPANGLDDKVAPCLKSTRFAHKPPAGQNPLQAFYKHDSDLPSSIH
jgi:hypothetical protein